MANNKDNVSKEIFNTLPLVFRVIRKTIHSLNIKLAPNQIKILHLIHCHSTTVNGLAEKLNVSPPTISEAVDSLLGKKLVKKVKSKIDGRITKITLTKLGLKEMANARKKIVSELDKKLNTLTRKEKQTLFKSMQILQEAFSINKKK